MELLPSEVETWIEGKNAFREFSCRLVKFVMPVKYPNVVWISKMFFRGKVQDRNIKFRDDQERV